MRLIELNKEEKEEVCEANFRFYIYYILLSHFEMGKYSLFYNCSLRAPELLNFFFFSLNTLILFLAEFNSPKLNGCISVK